MRNRILLLLLPVVLIGIIAAMPDDSPNKRLRFTKFGTTLNESSTTAKWKDWAGTWRSSDTTEPYNINLQNFRDDTIIIPYAATGATSGYCAAFKVQFGVNGKWKAPYTLDSLFQYGGALADGVETKGDSTFVGKPIYWLIKGPYAGATQFRLIIAKDTTNAADGNAGTTNSTTNTLEAGVIDP
jgi:hypothetical protein